MMFQLHTISIIFLIFLLVNIEYSEAGRTAKFRSASHRFNPKYFTNFTFSAKNDSVYLDMEVVHPLEMGFKANVAFQIRLRNSKNYQTLFSYTVDVCNMVSSYKNTIFKKWFRSLLRYGNFMQNCPVNSGHYYLNGWNLESELIPSYLYPGDYRITGYCYNGKFKTNDEEFVVELSVVAAITVD